MSEMRWNPILSEWVLTATHRQDRTFLPPAGYCPLCPTRDASSPTEVPEPTYDFVVFENKFPSMRTGAPAPPPAVSDLYEIAPPDGVCEVVLYTPNHTATLTQLPVDKIHELIYVWRDRYQELGARPEVKYVFIFENKGEAIGVTIHHPHGQIYAFPFIPPKVQRKIESEAQHFSNTGRCLHCDVIAQELKDGSRLVCSNDQFVAFIPFYARYPYEVHVYARDHVPSLAEFTDEHAEQLAHILKTVLQKYDNLWGFSLPYMMLMYQKPTDGKSYPGAHFYIEFLPPYRTAQKLKYLAGCESGAGTFVNDTRPEEKAAELRQAKSDRDATNDANNE